VHPIQQKPKELLCILLPIPRELPRHLADLGFQVLRSHAFRSVSGFY
jgi:hypothetical protein